MILIVTADGALRLTLESECLRAAQQVVHARTGREAMQKSEAYLLNLAVIDQELADTAGHQLSVALRNRHLELANVIVFTHRHSKETEAIVRRTGVILYAVLPDEDEQLRCVMRHSFASTALSQRSAQ